MRGILYLIGGLGTVMALGAAFLIIDQLITDDHRSSVRASVNDTIDDIEDSEGRRSRGLRGLISSYKALDNGIFRDTPVGIAAALPPAPEGWQKLEYTEAHCEAFTGTKARRALIVGVNTEDHLSKFRDTSKQRKMGEAITYVSPSGPILIRLSSSLKKYRIVEGTNLRQRDRYLRAAKVEDGSKLFATLDGLAIHETPALNKKLRKDGGYDTTPVDYRRFTFGVGRVIEGQIMTRTSDEDILTLLAGLNIAALQASLPTPSRGYTAGTGLVPEGVQEAALN